MCLAVIVGMKEEAVMKKERARNGSKLEEYIRWGIIAVDQEGFEQVDWIDLLPFCGTEQG